MDHDKITREIEDMASSFLSLDREIIDIRTAGKFLNQLEQILREIGSGLDPLKWVAGGLNTLLEKVVIDAVDEKQGYQTFEEGITLMQEIINGYGKAGTYDGDVDPFLDTLAAVTGSQLVKRQKTAEDDHAQETLDTGKTASTQDNTTFQIEDESLFKDFIVEALEYLGEIEVNVLNLEQTPDDLEYINAVFRPFHSIKGVAGFINLQDISGLAHEIETLLDRVRNRELSVTSEIIDIVLDGADALKVMIGNYQEILDGKSDTPPVFEVDGLYERIRGIDKYDDSGQGVKKLGSILVEQGVLTDENLEKSLLTAKEGAPKKLGETLILEGQVTPKQVSQALRKQVQQTAETQTVRIEVNRLDDLVDMIGELVICQSMIKQSPAMVQTNDQKLVRDVAQLATITSELQRMSTGFRMIPIKQTFQRMSRMVRDLAKKADKIISVELIGEDTEIDRNMVEEIYNPLVHMIRNSVDHGIEKPQERVKKGKPEKGTIRLNAFHRGGNVVIEISDDGAGLNRERILAKAKEKGLVTTDNGMSDEEVFHLIFLPGFSTAQAVTDVSGRGVGMDVVRQGVEKLRGKIEVASTGGAGTTITTLFPLTMAIVDGLIVRVGRERYIVPATAVRQLVRPREKAYTNVAGSGEMLDVMGDLLPLVRLNRLFGIDSDYREPWEALTVIIESGKRAKCLFVDEVLGKEEVVIKSLGNGMRKTKGISGGAILGDGNVGLILDPEGLFELSER